MRVTVGVCQHEAKENKKDESHRRCALNTEHFDSSPISEFQLGFGVKFSPFIKSSSSK
jgi:hypothetical protein